MEEPTTNGHLSNHVTNHISNNVDALKEAPKDVKPGTENQHRSSSKHHSSSSKHHSSSSSKHHSSSSKHSSSSSKHSSSSSKHHSSSSKDGKHSSSKHHSSSRDDKHHSSSSKDGKHHSSSSKDGKHHSSSSKDGKHHSSSSKHSSSSSKHSSSKDPSKHSSSSGSSHKSSSSSKDPSRHSSHSSSSKDPSKHSSSSSKHSSSKHHSSSSKHKDGSSSSSKPRDGEGDRPKVASPERPQTASPEPPKPAMTVKSEPMSPTIKTEPMSQTIKAEPISPLKMKIRLDCSDDDMPLNVRMDKVKTEPAFSPVKRPVESDDDDEPLAAKLAKVKKMKHEVKAEKSKKRKSVDDEDFEPEKSKKRKSVDDEDFEPAKKKKKKQHVKLEVSPRKEMTAAQIKRAQKKKDEEAATWKWWEEDKPDDGLKWSFLEHRGPILAPPYELLPDRIKFLYDGKVMKLTEATEEVATFYGRMSDHDYTTREIFNKNFMKDWRKFMTSAERDVLKDISLCDFRQILAHFKQMSEDRKAMSKEEKNKIKEENARMVEEYGYCIIDQHKQKIGNFRVEPPGLFRGRGDHPKQGMVKRRIQSEDIIINCSKNSAIPKAPEGHRWKEVRHCNQVTWLANWTENIQNQGKYVMLNAASKLKGEKDWKKYEMARNLHKHADRIRAEYRNDWKSKEMRVRQRSVAMYFIDKLALRAGNEKDEDQADTVGCCSLRVEHITLSEKMDDMEYVVEFDFLGKDSIRYYNKVSVEKRVFKNLQLFKDNKSDGDDLFDRLNTSILNKHLQTLFDGLTAKVFRTYNASKTLQEQLNLLTDEEDTIPGKMLSYNRANRAVAILCNHQRAAPKNFDKQMENLQEKIITKKEAVSSAKHEVKQAKSDFKASRSEVARKTIDRKKKTVERLEDQLNKLEVQATDKDENKEIALGTSKLNYLDPRISVAWCKKWEVPLEKIYNKTQRDKFAWAVDMTEEDYQF